MNTMQQYSENKRLVIGLSMSNLKQSTNAVLCSHYPLMYLFNNLFILPLHPFKEMKHSIFYMVTFAYSFLMTKYVQIIVYKKCSISFFIPIFDLKTVVVDNRCF